MNESQFLCKFYEECAYPGPWESARRNTLVDFREIGRAFRRLIVAQNARTLLTGDIQLHMHVRDVASRRDGRHFALGSDGIGSLHGC